MELAKFIGLIPELAADATLQQVAEIALISAAINILFIGFIMYYVFTRYSVPFLGLAAEAAVEAVKDARKGGN